MPPNRFDTLYREHYASVLGLCRRMLGGPGEAEDAAQEVFARAFRAFARYRPEQPFGAWVGAIASNHCIDLLRRRRRLDALIDSAEDTEALPATDNGTPALIAACEAAAVARAVEALPERYRLPVVLAYYADASYDDIAEALGVTRNHVGVLLLRARQRLRRDLHELQEEIPT